MVSSPDLHLWGHSKYMVTTILLVVLLAPTVSLAGSGGVDESVGAAPTSGPSEEGLKVPSPLPVPAAKWDCLGGVCLDAKAASYPKAVVTVSDRKWTRTVEVCSGRVVKIVLATGWHQAYFKWTDLLPGTSSSAGDDEGTLATAYYERLLTALTGKGWVLDGGGPARGCVHPEFRGERLVFSLPADDSALPGWRGWAVGLSTTHPEYADFCRSKFEQGL